MEELGRIRALLKLSGIELTINGPAATLKLPGSDEVTFARRHIGGIDWLVIKLNGKQIYQG